MNKLGKSDCLVNRIRLLNIFPCLMCYCGVCDCPVIMHVYGNHEVTSYSLRMIELKIVNLCQLHSRINHVIDEFCC